MTIYNTVSCKQALKACHFIVPSLLVGMQFNLSLQTFKKQNVSKLWQPNSLKKAVHHN